MKFKTFLLIVIAFCCLIIQSEVKSLHRDYKKAMEQINESFERLENKKVEMVKDSYFEDKRQGDPIEFVEGEFTAYNPTKEQCDDEPLIMASTKKVYDGAIACPSKYEFGTKINIVGLGEFICEDRMNKRYRDGEYFDIVMFDKNEANEFGRKKLVYNLIK